MDSVDTANSKDIKHTVVDAHAIFQSGIWSCAPAIHRSKVLMCLVSLDILSVDPKLNPEPLLFKSIGEGSWQINYSKVYSRFYEFEGHVVLYVFHIKRLHSLLMECQVHGHCQGQKTNQAFEAWESRKI